MTDDSLSTASNEVLVHECTTLAAQIASVTCRWLLVIAELDRRRVWADWGCKSMVHWLSWRCSVAPVTAREHVRIARALGDLPTMTAAFAGGELSYSKVRVLTRIADAGSEADLVEMARTATAAQLVKIVQASIAAMTDPAMRDALAELHQSIDHEGMGITKVRLEIDGHAIVEQAIAAAVAAESASAEAPIAQRRADAMVRICESYLATGAASRNPAARNNAVIHVEMTTEGVASAETHRGVPVPDETARRILCDATVQAIVGQVDEALGAGRTTRTIKRTLRRALQRRSHGRCEWTGCTETVFIEAHHVVHWEHGGPTEMANLVMLCWHHHHLVHEGGFSLVHDGHGTVRCYRHDGTEIHDPVPVLAPAVTLPTLPEAIITPLWAGETFDLAACVDAVISVTSASP